VNSGFASATLLTAEPLLLAVIGLLALVIFGLVAMAVILRRRGHAAPVAVESPRPPQVAAVASAPPPRPRVRPQMVRGAVGGGGLAVVTSAPTMSSGAMVCPTCRVEYHGMTYCTRDARRLVAPSDLLGSPLRSLALGKSAGLVCMACRRAFEPGLRECPHDSTELVPFAVYHSTRPRKRGATEPAGVVARICPVCGAKYDLNARFCGHDAGELVVIN